MTRSSQLLNRALPLAAALALIAGAAQATGPGNPSVFYCDAKTMADRQAEIFTIRQDVLPSLKEVMDDPSGGDDRVHATEEYAEYSARLKELLLGVESCRELRDFERYGEKGPPKKVEPAVEDDVLVPVAPPPTKRPPKKGPPKPPPPPPPPPPPVAEPEDDLLVPVPPVPKTTKAPGKGRGQSRPK